MRTATIAKLLAGAYGLVVLLWWLSGGHALQAEPKVRIRYWNGFTGPDGRTMLGIVRRFNREHPDVDVTMQRMDWHTYYNKLFVAGLGERAPEVFVVHASTLARFGRAGFLLPVDPLVAGDLPLDVTDLDANVWEAVNINGQHLGLPLDVHPQGLYYNKALLREAGLTTPDGEARPPETREEFLDALRRLKADTAGNGRTDRWGFTFCYWRNAIGCLIAQYGGPFFSPDLATCLLDDPRNAEALQFAADLFLKEHLVPTPEDTISWIGFRQGKVAMVIEGVYMLGDLQKLDTLEYAGAPLPQIGPEQGTFGDCHILCIRKGLDEETQRAAWEFVRYLSENSLDWAAGGQIPVRKSLRETQRFADMTVQSRFAEQIPYIRFPPKVPFLFEFYRELDLAIERTFRGRATAAEALREATENVNRVITRDRQLNAPVAEGES